MIYFFHQLHMDSKLNTEQESALLALGQEMQLTEEELLLKIREAGHHPSSVSPNMPSDIHQAIKKISGESEVENFGYEVSQAVFSLMKMSLITPLREITFKSQPYI